MRLSTCLLSAVLWGATVAPVQALSLNTLQIVRTPQPILTSAGTPYEYTLQSGTLKTSDGKILSGKLNVTLSLPSTDKNTYVVSGHTLAPGGKITVQQDFTGSSGKLALPVHLAGAGQIGTDTVDVSVQVPGLVIWTAKIANPNSKLLLRPAYLGNGQISVPMEYLTYGTGFDVVNLDDSGHQTGSLRFAPPNIVTDGAYTVGVSGNTVDVAGGITLSASYGSVSGLLKIDVPDQTATMKEVGDPTLGETLSYGPSGSYDPASELWSGMDTRVMVGNLVTTQGSQITTYGWTVPAALTPATKWWIMARGKWGISASGYTDPVTMGVAPVGGGAGWLLTGNSLAGTHYGVLLPDGELALQFNQTLFFLGPDGTYAFTLSGSAIPNMGLGVASAGNSWAIGTPGGLILVKKDLSSAKAVASGYLCSGTAWSRMAPSFSTAAAGPNHHFAVSCNVSIAQLNLAAAAKYFSSETVTQFPSDIQVKSNLPALAGQDDSSSLPIKNVTSGVMPSTEVMSATYQ